MRIMVWFKRCSAVCAGGKDTSLSCNISELFCIFAAINNIRYYGFDCKGTKKVNKTAIYCRISTQMQSTDRQKEDLLKVAERFEYEIDAEHIYIDIITGFSVGEDRPNYSALLGEVEKGNIDTILFSELTRLGRNSTELLAEVQRLQDKGIDLYFEKQDLWVRHDKKDLGSRILLAVLAITTSYEIELFAERSISGKIDPTTGGKPR